LNFGTGQKEKSPCPCGEEVRRGEQGHTMRKIRLSLLYLFSQSGQAKVCGKPDRAWDGAGGAGPIRKR